MIITYETILVISECFTKTTLKRQEKAEKIFYFNGFIALFGQCRMQSSKVKGICLRDGRMGELVDSICPFVAATKPL